MYGRVIVFPKKEVTMFRNRHLIKTHETDLPYPATHILIAKVICMLLIMVPHIENI